MKNITLLLLTLNIAYAEIVTLTSGNSISDSITQNEEKQYKITVPAGKELLSSLTNLTADGDIYVKVGSIPTAIEYDCRSVNGGVNDDTCSIVLASDAEVFVTVYGFRATNYTLTGTISTPDAVTITDINLNQALNDSVEQKAFKYYKLSAQAGIELNSVIKQLSADADIYVKLGDKPTKDNYDCRSLNGGTNSDSCLLTPDNNADLYIGVYGYRAATYQLIVQNAANQVETLVSQTTVNGSLGLRESKAYKISAVSGAKVTALLSNLSADLDLYVKAGSIASRDSYDARSINGQTNNENYEQVLNSNSDIYFTVYAYRAGSYSLLVNNDGGDNNGDTELIEPGNSVQRSISQGEMKYYKVTENNEDIKSLLSNLSVDIDLYVKIGDKPTTTSFDCKSTNGASNNEECIVSGYNNQEDVYIGVYGYRAGNYTLTVNTRNTLIAPTVYEDGENGVPNPAWERSGDESYAPSLFPTPNIEGAPSGDATLVLVPHGSGDLGLVSYSLPVNNFTQTILSMDLGGLPTYRRPGAPRGYIVHYAVGVSVETLLGTRKMLWYSFFNHNNANAFKNGSILNYPSPVEQVRGYGYAPITQWDHFEVNLNTQLQELEPGNKIYKVNYFFASGGFLDNIQLSLDTQ